MPYCHLTGFVYLCTCFGSIFPKVSTNMKNIFTIIRNLKHLGVWKDVLFLASRLYTLDRYYDVYSFIIESEPDRRYGYIPRILNNPTFKTRFGTQYDESAIKKIILTMDKSLPK